MTVDALGFVNSIFDTLGIPYEFGEWTDKVPSTYWTGSYIEEESKNEDGKEESTFFLTGNSIDGYFNLEKVKTDLKNYLGTCGQSKIFEDGSAVIVLYDKSMPIPSVEYGVKRLEISLTIKEWRC